MKLIILALLIVFVASQTTTLCPGYKVSGTCYNSITGTGDFPALTRCLTYDEKNPKKCTSCFPGFKVYQSLTDSLSAYCIYDTAYTHYNYFPSSDTDYQYCVNFGTSWSTYLADSTKMPWTSLSCIDGDKQLLCRCRPGYVYQTATLKCAACGSNCATCKADATATCYSCNGGYFLSSTNACSQCTTNALTCATDKKAASCNSGYYLKTDDGTCVSCPKANSTCTSATDYTCGNGYYKATAGDCTACGTNVALCSSAPVTNSDSGIVECNKPDATNVYYKTSKGCQSTASSKNCYTITVDTTNCSACLFGYTLSTGQCYPCISTQFTTATIAGTVTGVLTCTAGTDTTAGTAATCQTGYFVHTTKKCESCGGGNGITNCSTCTGATACTKCADGYQAKADSTACVVCGEAAVCKECTLNASNAFKKCTTYINHTKVQTGGVDDGALAAVSSVTTYLVTNCATGLLWLADATMYSGPSSAKKVKCLTCDAAKVLYADGVTATAGQSICLAEGDGSANTVNTQYCLEAQQTTTGTIAAPGDMTCTICREGYFRTANSSAFKCVACNSSDCAVCSSTAASMCTKCKSSVSKVVVAGVCTANVTNCKADTATATYNVGGTSVTCTECATNYIKKSDGSACLDCTSVTNCTTHVAASDNSACKCSLCTFNTVTDVYYYINSTGTCTNTNPSNCGYFDSNGIAANCYYCNVGYKWKKTATTAECTACNSTDFKCTVGADACAGLNYPGKPSAAAAAAAANSSIISLVLSLLLALITLLI